MRIPKLHLILGLLLTGLLIPEGVYAQMFSVQKEKYQRRIGPVNQIYIGWEPTDFSYYGPAQTDVQRTPYDMERPLFRIRYESFGTELFLGYADDVTGSDTVDFFHIGGSFSRPIPVYRDKRVQLLIPIRLQADMTIASNERSVGDKFQQSNILIGTGAGVGLNLSSKIRWKTSLIPLLGYSVSPGGTFGGVTYQLSGSTRLMAVDLFRSVGLSIGYDYTYKKYDISVDRFDYTLRAHSLLIGVTF